MVSHFLIIKKPILFKHLTLYTEDHLDVNTSYFEGMVNLFT